MKQTQLILSERIERRVFFIRGQRVMLDNDLAKIYGVSTSRLNQQVKRNMNRFPDDFMFQITKEELRSLMLQNATSNTSRGGRRKLPSAFTEHGTLMAANVLKSNKAVRMSVFVVRAFVRLREVLATHKELAQKFKELEGRIEKHDYELTAIFESNPSIDGTSGKAKTENRILGKGNYFLIHLIMESKKQCGTRAKKLANKPDKN